jgi:cysteine dioxygenase
VQGETKVWFFIIYKIKSKSNPNPNQRLSSTTTTDNTKAQSNQQLIQSINQSINPSIRTMIVAANTCCKGNVIMKAAIAGARNTTAAVAVMRNSSPICWNHLHFSSVSYQKYHPDQDQDQDYDHRQSSLSLSSSSFLTNVSSSSSSSLSKWWNNQKIKNKNNSNRTTTGSNTTNTTNTKIRHIQDFINEIPEAVTQRKIENIEPGAYNDPVARLFRQSELSPTDDWLKYAIFNNEKPYTRNLISTDHDTYTLLLLCWNPEQESPIHDHPSDGCWLQVLDGSIKEVRYDKELKTIAEFEYNHGELSYITDNIGYHKISSNNKKRAVTLHLYAPPFDTCHCWYSDTANPSEPCIGHTIHHSEYGVVVVKEEEAGDDIAA